MTSVLDQLRQAKAGATAKTDAPAAPAAPRVGSYQRISDAYESAETGITTAGVDRQAEACKHIADARGWIIERPYVDNNVSAFKEAVRRDAFEEMLADLDAGVIDGIVCYNLDRFARRTEDLDRAIRVYDRARQSDRPIYFATAEGDLNLASDDGLTMARVMVAFANKSSRDTARRVSAKHRSTRDAGRQVSGARPFGWDIIGGERVLNDAEAAAIRWAASGLTTGALTWRDVMTEWNDRSLLTPQTGAKGGNRWQPQTVKQTMRSPRLAGWVVHHDAIAVHSQTGELIRGTAPAILTDDEYEALLAATQSDSGNFTAASGRRKYLLSGLARCQVCGGRMIGNAQPRSFVYKCGQAECGKVTCSGSGLDAHLTELVLPRVIAESRRLRFAKLSPYVDEEHLLTEERTGLVDGHTAGRLVADLVFPRVAEIDKRLEVIRQAHALHVMAQRQLGGSPITEESWAAMTDDERRTHVARHLEAVYVRPRIRNTGRYFDPERVSAPVWKVTS